MTSHAGTPAAVRWLPWTNSAFQRARDEQKPLLLSISVAWSRACAEMDAACYADGEVASEINRWFIPVRVDADRRPDIADRYDLGGLPSTAFLDYDGRILGGGTFVPRARMLDALKRARAPHPAPSDVPPAPSDVPPAPSREANRAPSDVERAPSDVERAPSDVPPAPSHIQPAPSREADLPDLVWSAFDRLHGGFGEAPKFPLVAPVALALDHYQESGTSRMAEYVTLTLDAMGWGPLFDADSGGFFRCAADQDWNTPEQGRLLTTNAALASLYLDAGAVFENQRWLARGADVISFVESVLRVRGSDGWRASDCSDNTRLTDGNAAMVRACLNASRSFADRSLGEQALATLESVLLATYRPGRGVAHCDGGVRGLLTDHVAMIQAQLDAFDATGNVVYRMMAEELAHHAIRTLEDEHEGGFFDRAAGDDDEVGLLRRRIKPFALNCEAALALDRLGRAAGEDSFRAAAARALDAVAHEAMRQGPLAAHYLLARRALAR